jgi:GTP pyrophosphokinase
VALSHELVSGDSVEILTSKGPASPSRDWLRIVKTPRARNKIRQWFARERREDALAQGKEALLQAMKKQGLPAERIARGDAPGKVAEELKFADVDAMFVAIGEGHLSPQSVTTRIMRAFEPEAGDDEPESGPPRRRRRRANRGKGIIVEGHDDLLVRLARCCTPVPGDRVVGFLTRGRGVSVHREDCPNAKSLSVADDERMAEVWWDDRQQSTFVAAIQIDALDRTKLLRDVTAAISDHGIHILSSTTRARRDGIASLTFTLELGDPGHLQHVLQSVRRIDSVFDAYRIVSSSARA